jgi:hypothetical protein
MSPSVLLEPIFTTHGDTLYRVALLLAPNERRAEQLLHALAAELAAALPLTPPGDVELLARLVALARTAEAKQKPQRKQPRNAGASPIYRSLHSQPLDQRLTLGLHLLLGYDSSRIAAVLGNDPPAAGQLLEQAMRAIAPAAGSDLPDRVSSDHCYAVRAALIDTASRERHSAAVRGHLAGCAPCRSFDQRWIEIGQAAEDALRQELRPRQLPGDLFNRLITYGAPRTRDRLRPYRFAIPLVAVLVLVGALVLPGFTQRAVTIVDRGSDPLTVDPTALLSQALELHTQPPSTGPAIWHGRFETLWYFDERTFAPLHADIWLDRGNPARHRAQITHRDGGAPYELQVGSGDDRLYYALDAAYAPVLYSALNTGALPDRPRLSAFTSSPTEQRAALEERLRAGPWMIPLFYLEQALNADDLRVLGRQRDGERTVQILSFVGVSPLSPPGSEAEPVTVLLALDNNGGRLRSATELIGPAGGTQVSRVTWRLIDEEQFEGEQSIRRAFMIDNAWNGLGDFATVPPQQLADPALPFLSSALLSDPTIILSRFLLPIWMPATPPPGVDRAMLIGGSAQIDIQQIPEAVVYLGPERRLSIRYGRNQPLVGETQTIGIWDVTLRAERGGAINAFLQREPQHSATRLDTGIRELFIEARGFTPSELQAIIADLRPLDLDSLTAQEALFSRPEWGDPAARQALLNLLQPQFRAEADQAIYTRWNVTRRVTPQTQQPLDPYTSQLATALATAYQLEYWFIPTAEDPVTITQIRTPDQAEILTQQYVGQERSWVYDAVNSTTTIYPIGPRALIRRVSEPLVLIIDLLTDTDWNLELSTDSSGTRRIQAVIPVESSEYYFSRMTQPQTDTGVLYDLQPETIITEVELGPADELRAIQVYAFNPRIPGGTGSAESERILLQTYERTDYRQQDLSDVPALVNNPEPPQADLIRDYSGIQDLLVSDTTSNLNAVIILAPFPIYTLPQAELRDIEQNLVVIGRGYRFPFSFNETDDLLRIAVQAGLAVRLNYELTDVGLVQITQGPAAALRAYLRTSPQTLWTNPEPIDVTIAGQAAEGWIGDLPNGRRLIVEIDEQLFIIDAPPDSGEALLPLLNALQPN